MEDDDNLAEAILEVLLLASFHVDIARSGLEARRQIAEDCAYDLVITDVEMAGNGNSVLALMHAAAPETPLVVISGKPRASVDSGLLSIGRVTFLRKPFSASHLRRVVTGLLSAHFTAAHEEAPDPSGAG